MLEKFSQKYQPQIEKNLADTISFTDFNDPRNLLKEAISHSVLARAKRIRPLLVLASFLLFREEAEVKKIMPLAVAIELVHTYSLIHDDLPAMDNDDFRRGQPTCHKKYGEDIAILAGDVLNTFCFENLAHVLPQYFSAKKSLKAIEMLSYYMGFFGMAGGQVLDLKSSSQSLDDIYLIKMHNLKTGALIKACLEIPAFLAGASNKESAILAEFGLNLGLLFQIVDDILDITGKKEDLGKSIAKDKAQNKLTYVKLWGQAEAQNKAQILALESKRLLKDLSARNTKLLSDFVDYILIRKS